MTSEEFKNLSKEEKSKIKFKDLPKFNKFAMVFFITIMVVILSTCVGTCVSGGDSGSSSGVDSTMLQIKSQRMAETAVKSILKSPASAQFPSEEQHFWFMPDSTVVVKGVVDAQNTFGALLRSPFYVRLKWYGDYEKEENWAVLDAKLEE